MFHRFVPVATLVVTLIALCQFPNQLQASHVAGGTFNAQCLGPDPNDPNNQLYELTMILYRDCEGTDLFNTIDNNRLHGRGYDRPIPLLIRSSCGGTTEIINVDQMQVQELTQICDDQSNNSSCNGGYLPGIQEATMTFNLSLDPGCDYEFEWWAPTRNNNIRNLRRADEHTMYWFAEMNLTIDPCMSLKSVVHRQYSLKVP